MRNESDTNASLVICDECCDRRQPDVFRYAGTLALELWEMGKVEAIVMAKRGYGRNKQHCQAGPPAINFHLKYAIKDGSIIDCRGRHDMKEKYAAGRIAEYCTRCPYEKGIRWLST